jgi:hypothetical protein
MKMKRKGETSMENSTHTNGKKRIEVRRWKSLLWGII